MFLSSKNKKNLFGICFRHSKSKYFEQCKELSLMAYKYLTKNIEGEKFYVAFFKKDQIDLMALLYILAKKLPNKGMYFLWKKNREKYNEISEYHREVFKLLLKEGYLDPQKPWKLIKKPKESIPEYIKIKKFIKEKKYVVAVKSYYKKLGKKFYDWLQPELVYLKRIGNIPLVGRDILYYKTESYRNELIENNIEEYCECINKVLDIYRKKNMKLPMEILRKNSRTIKDLISKRKKLVEIKDGEIKKYCKFPEKLNYVLREKVPEGRLFHRYIDQVMDCQLNEYKELKKFGLWTKISPSFLKNQIINNNYSLRPGLPCYQEKSFKIDGKIFSARRSFSNPKDLIYEGVKLDFTKVDSLKDIEEVVGFCDRIKYTGRIHLIGEIKFYEVNTYRYVVKTNKKLATVNPFKELIYEILRNAENLLRENHNLPKIGEGWISEMKMYNLIKKFFKDTKHHASPSWLNPQHFDAYVPSERIAFEYQGKQHFEPVEFFGGEDSFYNMKKLDKRKKRKCKKNSITLIEWRFDEKITKKVLFKKLVQHFSKDKINKIIKK